MSAVTQGDNPEVLEKVVKFGDPKCKSCKPPSPCKKQGLKVDTVQIEDLMDSDPDIEFIEKDSGMSSLGGSKDETPERRAVATTSSTANDKDNLDDEPDETLSERLWGLTEMFPEPLRNLTAKCADLTVNGVKGIYSFTCNASWIVFTTSVILFAPVIFETERAQMAEMQKSQQKQVLLGPGSAMSATGPPQNLPLIR